MINFVLKTNAFLKKKKTPGNTGFLDFPKYAILRYVEAFSVRLLIVGVYFLLISLIFFRSIVVYLKLGSRLTFFCHFPLFSYFLQKYRCVPKIGFSADIFIDIFIDISIDISIDIFIDISIDILTDREGGRKEGVDLFLKSNDPTPEGEEKQTFERQKNDY